MVDGFVGNMLNQSLTLSLIGERRSNEINLAHAVVGRSSSIVMGVQRSNVRSTRVHCCFGWIALFLSG
jgi:hypothetical protein